MKRNAGISAVLIALMLLTGCSTVGSKSLTMTAAYAATAVISCLIPAAYLRLIKKKEPWFMVLMVSVIVVNIGYWALAASESLSGALMANRVAYAGSVVLPLAMLQIILRTAGIRWPRAVTGGLIAAAAAVFLVAASPGYLDIYYSEVTLASINGATVLEKVYGPWHSIYLIYLAAYMCATIAVLVYSFAHRRLHSTLRAAMLAAAVLANLGIWLLEQLVRIDFEMLAVSYIISELFMLVQALLQQEHERLMEAAAAPAPESAPALSPAAEYLAAQLPRLTATEKVVYDMYTAGASSREIMEKLEIKENTLKYHNRNIYSKLGVSSRKQLLEAAAELKNN